MASWIHAFVWRQAAAELSWRMATAAPPLATPTVVRHAVARRSAATRSPLVQALSRTLRNPMGFFGAGVVGILVFAALAAPIISPYDPIAQHPGLELRPPSAQFLLGTDHLGRDLLSRIIFGSRSSLLIGMVAVGLGAGFGIASGLAAGYLGGWVDAVLMRFYDALLSFPAILLGIGVVSVLGSGPISVAYALAFATVPTFARLMRARVLTEREREYVVAARCIGARGVRPDVSRPRHPAADAIVGWHAEREPSLPPHRPLVRQFLRLALALLLLGLNCLSDALRDALDPRRSNA